MPMRPRRRRRGFAGFLLEVVDQLLQAVWPPERVLRHNSAVIFGTVAVIAASIVALDFAFGGAFTQLLGHH
jgi:preprotein translocase subunit SecE